jgi:hypothetical protein
LYFCSLKHWFETGVWRSWLACLTGGQEVASSSLATPTDKQRLFRLKDSLFFVSDRHKSKV